MCRLLVYSFDGKRLNVRSCKHHAPLWGKPVGAKVWKPGCKWYVAQSLATRNVWQGPFESELDATAALVLWMGVN